MARFLPLLVLTLGGCVPVSVPTTAPEPAQPKPAGSLTKEHASAFAKLALKGADKEYPHKPGIVFAGVADVKNPKALHPAFFGCFDWHSAVHGHWLLVRVLKQFPDLPEAKQIRAVLTDHLTEANLKAEAEYFARGDAKSFERPYGWTWLLKLAEELHTWDDPDAKQWSANLKPLAELLSKRYIDHFPKQTYPIRAGVHSNTAFGLSFAHDYARTVGDKKLQTAIEERARSYYGKDADAPARWEPDGADFLSPSLCEADLMRRVLPAAEFQEWFALYLPGAAKGEPKTLFAPATITDRTDPQLVHLDGLNLSRGWSMRGIITALPKDSPTRAALAASAAVHADAGLKHIASGDYAGEHWLASFAVYMLSTPAP
ncbi:MAG: DUF2891 domain-containing protein [Planctomycetaceae bacterium]|nr:DUF2891 domain-containing protein [Planctomycetaceae bacterium]